MPIYEYRCRKCGETFEREEHVTDHEPGKARCPKCKSKGVSQVLGSFFAKTSRKS
ncbi:MAG: zinc ribbon domain-containing protein [Gammaproteobacteria bacterium]|nr:zinc ribbon domain-containing protein [Gammaproteobacteria bacterium]MDH3467687.1 zinc ribbon domain-containing protein [Gammaproteobacteria bacterium]